MNYKGKMLYEDNVYCGVAKQILELEYYIFHNYIKIHKADCIKAVKRSLNYKTIDSSVSKNFKNKF